jgi:hypothetical protein
MLDTRSQVFDIDTTARWFSRRDLTAYIIIINCLAGALASFQTRRMQKNIYSQMDVQIERQYASHSNILSRRANFDSICHLDRVPNYPAAEDASLWIVQGVQHLSRACTPALEY